MSNPDIQKIIDEYLAGPVFTMSYSKFLNKKKEAKLL